MNIIKNILRHVLDDSQCSVFCATQILASFSHSDNKAIALFDSS